LIASTAAANNIAGIKARIDWRETDMGAGLLKHPELKYY